MNFYKTKPIATSKAQEDQVRLVPTGTTESELAGVFYVEQGLDRRRVTLESNILDGVLNVWQFDGLADLAA